MAGKNAGRGAGASSSTRDRLLDKAEELFGERGYEGTSLRNLAETSGANVAAVNYHFGSKEGLLKAVVARAMEPVNTERDQRLNALQAASARPSLEQVIRAFIEPGLELIERHGDRGPAVAKFVGRVLFDPSPHIRQLFADQVDDVEGRFIDALDEALPGRDRDAVIFGYTSMLGLLALHQSGMFAGLRWRLDEPGGDTAARGASDAADRLVGFISSGLTGRFGADRHGGEVPSGAVPDSARD